MAGFPDFGFTVEDLFRADDRVAARVTVRGTHEGEFMGRPPTGKRFAVTSVGIFRIADGRIAEHWGVSISSRCSLNSEPSGVEGHGGRDAVLARLRRSGGWLKEGL